MELVTLKTCCNLNEADMIQARLENYDIESFIPDASTANINIFYANAGGGIRVQVKDTDLVRASEVLGLPPAQTTTLESDVLCCPKCGSEHIKSQRFTPKLALLSIILVGIPIPYIKRMRRCLDCHALWQVRKQAGRL